MEFFISGIKEVKHELTIPKPAVVHDLDHGSYKIEDAVLGSMHLTLEIDLISSGDFSKYILNGELNRDALYGDIIKERIKLV